MVELTKQNFEKEVLQSSIPVLVDFWAIWCQPCSILSPILEKLEEKFKKRVIFAQANLDTIPFIAQKFSVERIPTVILFKKGKPIAGFIGVKAEPIIEDWLNEVLEKEQNEKDEEKEQDLEEKEKIERLIEWYRKHAKENGFRLNPDQEAVERLVKGLLANEKKYGERYCPCRRIAGNKEEDNPKICPCKWHKEEIEKDGHCFCGLFKRSIIKF